MPQNPTLMIKSPTSELDSAQIGRKTEDGPFGAEKRQLKDGLRVYGVEGLGFRV